MLSGSTLPVTHARTHTSMLTPRLTLTLGKPFDFTIGNGDVGVRTSAHPANHLLTHKSTSPSHLPTKSEIPPQAHPRPATYPPSHEKYNQSHLLTPMPTQKTRTAHTHAQHTLNTHHTACTDDALPHPQVIQGWDEGILGMSLGEKSRLKIPSMMAYGAKGTGT